MTGAISIGAIPSHIGIPAGAPDPWLPTKLPNLVLWLAADRGINGVGDGARITTWADQSGQGNDATQSGDPRPLYQTGRLNGLPGVEFDGVDASMALAGSLFSGDANVTIAIVYDDNDALTNPHAGSLAGQAVDAVGGTWFMIQSRLQAGATGAPYFAGFSADVTSAAPDANPHYGIVTHDGTNILCRLDGSQVGSGTPTLNTTADEFLLGHSRASDPTEGEFLTGDIYEVIVCTSTLAGADLTQLESYLSTKWGL